MGMGLSIEVIEIEWPTEEFPARCSQCGSRLLLTRYQRQTSWLGDVILPLPPDIAALEAEQYCPVCGAAACEEDEGIKTIAVKNRSRDFFSEFRK